MYEQFIYTNEHGDSVEFSALGLYHMKSVSGLSDMRNTIFSVSTMGQDGDTFVGGRIESRDIEIVGAIRSRDKMEVQSLRRRLYRTLNPKLTATLTYIYGDFTRIIDCVPDNAPVFNKSAVLQGFTIQLSCLNPFWRDSLETKADIAAWFGSFEFPLEIPETTGIEMGYREPSLIFNIFNNGDVKSGMRVEFKAVGTVVNPDIFNLETREFIKLNYTMAAGEIFRVNTNFANKTVKLYSGGQEINAFRHLDVNSTFIQLNVGDNMFRYGADNYIDNLEVSIYHNNQYLGV